MQPNPHGCCEVDTECCDNRLPDTLKATITNVAGCPNADELEITLRWDGGSWEGSADCGGETIQLTILCDVQMEAGCSELQLQYDFGCTVDGQVNPDAGCTCDPLNLVYSVTGIPQTGCGCCEENENVELTVTVTE